MSAEIDATVTTSGSLAKMASFGKHLADRAQLDSDEIDGTEIAANIATKILTATTLEDVFAADEAALPGGRDLVGVEQRIFGFDIRKSTDPDKNNDLVGGVFLVVRAMNLSNGEDMPWNTSATGIVAKLYKCEQLGYFDPNLPVGDPKSYIDCKVVQKGTSNAISLALLPKRVA